MRLTYFLAKASLRWLSACTLLLLLAVSCQKELDAFDPLKGQGGSLDSLGRYGIMFRDNDSTTVRGCIDTAYVEQAANLSVLNISASDTSAVYDYVLNVITNSGQRFTPGDYLAVQGRASITLQKDTATFIPALANSDFTVSLVTVTDSLITGIFSGTLVNITNPGQTLRISQGAFKAYLGRPNPCPAPPVPPAVFTIAAGPNGECVNFVPNGSYFKDSSLQMTTNTLSVQVDVTTPGGYDISLGPVSGYRFAATGVFNTTGVQTVVLQGIGKPNRVGTDTFPVTLGTVNCKFLVTVGPTQITAPCNPNNNSATYQGQNINFDSVVLSKDSISYIMRGQALSGQLVLAFRDSSQVPVQGIYTIVPPTSANFSAGQVRARIAVGPNTFTASQGSVFVLDLGSGRISATLCNVSFSGSFAGQPVSGLGSAKLSSP